MIELDGSQHQEEKNIRKDSGRENYLESQGVRVLLFWNHEIFKQKKDVLEAAFYLFTPLWPTRLAPVGPVSPSRGETIQAASSKQQRPSKKVEHPVKYV